jgi:hypothetical protein
MSDFWAGLGSEPVYGPVSDTALNVGRIIAEHTDFSGVHSVDLVTVPPSKGIGLGLWGADHPGDRTDMDSFSAHFGSYELPSGSWSIRFAPFPMNVLAPGPKPIQTAFEELFGEVPFLNPDEADGRVTVGIMHQDGTLVPNRPYNERPFGCHFGRILYEARQALNGQQMHLTVRPKYVTELIED